MGGRLQIGTVAGFKSVRPGRLRPFRSLLVPLILFGAIASPSSSYSQIGISVAIAPPVLPAYVQPPTNQISCAGAVPSWIGQALDDSPLDWIYGPAEDDGC